MKKINVKHLFYSLNTQNNGINQLEIQAFYKIGGIFIPSNSYILNYDVVDEIPTIEKVVIVEKVVEKEKIIEVENVKEFFTTIPLTAKIIGGILIFFMLLRMF